MPTNPNMVAIQTVTVGAGGAASIEFTSIPQTYTDLCILISAREVSGASGVAYIKPNGSTSNLSRRILYGLGNSSGSATGTDWAFYIDSSAFTASTFGNTSVYIPNYTSSNNKSASIDSVTENNATSAFMMLNAALWSNSAAITSITLSADGGSFAQYSTATLYGVTSAGYGAKATGGIISQDANYFYHTFLASGTFTPTSNITADYLVVAGGGSGGVGRGGGGGGGGLKCTVGATGGGGSLPSAVSLSNGTAYTITVGGGGAVPTSNTSRGSDGSNSSISGSGLTTITSNGGGSGGNQDFGATDKTVIGNAGSTGRATGFAGGSGGGSGGRGEAYDGGTGATSQGYTGGSSTGTANYPTGGGGGAGAAGGNATAGTTCGNGGNGVQTSISGTATYYAGGGGGAAYDVTTQGTGGLGGGGDGRKTGGGDNGDANTGGGGGGGTDATNTGNSNAGAGGSGIVIVRYAK